VAVQCVARIAPLSAARKLWLTASEVEHTTMHSEVKIS